MIVSVDLFRDQHSEPNGFAIIRFIHSIDCDTVARLSRTPFRTFPVRLFVFETENEVSYFFQQYVNVLALDFPREVPAALPLLFIFGYQAAFLPLKGVLSLELEGGAESIWLQFNGQEVIQVAVKDDKALTRAITKLNHFDGEKVRACGVYSHSTMTGVKVKMCSAELLQAVRAFGEVKEAIELEDELWIEMEDVRTARQLVGVINCVFGNQRTIATITDPQAMRAKCRHRSDCLRQRS